MGTWLCAQLCLTLCDPMCCRLPDSSVHGIFQVRILEWVVISYSRDLANSGIKPTSPALLADYSPLHHLGSPVYGYTTSQFFCEK